MAPKPEWQEKDYYADLGVAKTATEAAALPLATDDADVRGHDV